MSDLAAEALAAADAVYTRGFIHGRRRAAEDVAKLIDAFDGNTRDILVKAARVALNGPEAVLSAPSEPVQDEPRAWELPTIPEDVKALRDAEGRVWRRELKGWRRDTTAWTGKDLLLLLAYHPRLSPLTEVVNTDGD